MIDLHCHVLPGVDDGPPGLEDALALLAAAAAGGTRTMVATPHVSATYPNNSGERLEDAVAELREAARAAGIAIEIVAGAELSLLHCDTLSKEEGSLLRLGDAPYTLVELPVVATPQNVEMLLGMHYWVHPVVLAHPERCTAFQGDLDLLHRLVGQGMLVQVTAASFGGRFGSTVRQASWQMLGEGLVHVVASDCHDLRSRTPLLREPLEEAGLGELVPVLCDRGPAAVLAGERPDPAPAVAPPRSFGIKRLMRRHPRGGARRG